MPRNPYDVVASIHRVLGWAFALVGLGCLAAPNGTVRAVNAIGAVFRVLPPAPESELRFWVSWSFAYMVLVTVLAWRIASDPRKHRGLMPILAAGKLASSFTCLVFFVFHQPAFLYLLNFLVDGAIVLIVIGCYVWLAVVEQASQRRPEPQGKTAERLRLLTGTMVPEGGPFEAGATTLHLDKAVWRYFGQLHQFGSVGLTAILYAIEYGPVIFGPRRRRFSQLRPEEREAHLSGWESSRCAVRRQLLHGVKLAIMLHFYDSPEVCARVGYDGTYVRDKLLAGPNAAFHRARLS